MRRLVNLAKFYAALIAEGSLSMAVLKKLDFTSTYLPAKESMFAEVLLTSVLFTLQKNSAKAMKEQGKGTNDRSTTDADSAFESAVRKVLTVAGVPEMVAGLQSFIRNVVDGSSLARTKKEKRALDAGCAVALETLASAEKMTLGGGDSSGDESA